MHYGKYRGRVEDNKDKEGRGRILISCKAVLGDFNVWAEPCFVPNVIALPDKGDMIWVEFEGGNKNYPIWVGCMYTKNKLAVMLNNKPVSANNVAFSYPKKVVTGDIDAKEAVVKAKKVALHDDEVNTTITHTTGVVSGSTVVTSVSPSKGKIDTKR